MNKMRKAVRRVLSSLLKIRLFRNALLRWIAVSLPPVVELSADALRLALRAIVLNMSRVPARSMDAITSAILPYLGDVSLETLSQLTEEAFLRYARLNAGRYLPDWCLSTVKSVTESTLGYGQEGEDILLERLGIGGAHGVFVDVGAYQPIAYSNTYRLYRAGWRGINIDAMPGSMEAFRRVRPDDINLEVAISDTTKALRYHVFETKALNTFDAELAATYVSRGERLAETREIIPRTLASVLGEHKDRAKSIQLMTIDVEGSELGVLQSNDWDLYAPEWVVVELIETPLEALTDHPCIQFLCGQGYRPVSRLCYSVILRRR